MEKIIIRFFLLLISGCTLILHSGCSSESLGSGGSGGSGDEDCPAVGDLSVESSTGLGGGQFCLVGGTLTEDATISGPGNGFEWRLDGDITVEDVTLTINAGVEIFGEGDDEFIYISNGAALDAVGFADAPIVLSSNDSDNSGGGEWGGLIIESLLSGGAAQRLEYVVVAEAGAEVAMGGETYSANLTLVGEHSDTQIRSLQSHASSNDGIALVSSGAENEALLESVLITAPAANGVYFDNFSGLLKNLLVIQEESNVIGAGINGNGMNSDPLIINVTLLGQDLSSSIGSTKIGLLFSEDYELPRIANSLVINYRHGCYRVADPSDLSTVSIDSIPDPVFLDGVHCVNEFAEASGVDSAPIGGIHLPLALVNIGASGPGLSFYENVNAEFESEASSATDTAAYYLTRIATLENGTNDLRRYNGGDADLDGDTDADDEIASPLFGEVGIYEGIGVPAFDGFACEAPSRLSDGAEFYDPDTGLAIDPQPTGDALTCGFLRIPSLSSAFNLTIIGAIESATDTRFDDWTIEGSL